MIRKLSLLYHTVRHLKFKQIRYQIYYRLAKAESFASYQADFNPEKLHRPTFRKNPPVHKSLVGYNSFIFLNISVIYPNEVDWDDQRYGKLWNYNLQYFNYLLQRDVDDIAKLSLLQSFYKALLDKKIELEPYPVSLRTINIIRWYSQNQIRNDEILKYVKAELNFLSKRPEYHLLGNHLLENAFALLLGGAFFENSSWVQQGQDILTKELEEQILSDGAHFELSPMYHQIIFFRMLELIDWYSKWDHHNASFLTFLKQKASIMRSWLLHIRFDSGDIPHFNDSTDGIAFSSSWLDDYAKELGVSLSKVVLGASGYRSVSRRIYECKIDLAQLGSSYQPGHAHADALSFILYHKGKPLFVEQGTSTYQIGELRNAERSTAAHNTVVVNHKNQSNVWGGFRVAERAHVTIIEDQSDSLAACHNGYRKYGIKHLRRFFFTDQNIIIADELNGNDKLSKEFHLHVHPHRSISLTHESSISIDGSIQISFDQHVEIRLEDYKIAKGYNQYQNAKKIVVTFVDKLTTHITL